MKLTDLEPRERARIQSEMARLVLRHIKIALHAGSWSAFTNLMTGDRLQKNVVEPLETMSGWNEHMEREARPRATEMKELNEYPPEQRTRRLWKILGFGGAVTGATIATITALIYNHRKKKKENAPD